MTTAEFLLAAIRAANRSEALVLLAEEYVARAKRAVQAGAR